MRIGFDATSLTLQRTGIGRYTLELLRALLEHEPDIDLSLLAHRSLEPSIASDLDHLRRLGTPGFPVKLAWMQTVLPLRVGRGDVDLCHYTNYQAPLASRVPFVVNIHDMSLVVMPERHPTRRVVLMRPLLRAIAHRAAAVLTLTESARQDAIRHLDVRPENVRVVPAAPAPGFGLIDDEEQLRSVGERYGVEPGFLLFVGTIEPRKNIRRLIEAYDMVRRDGFNAPLVICGGSGWKSVDIKPTVERLGLTDAVIFTGFVPDDDLVGLLNICGAFAYPSLYEGYGLPIIEALACGAPTITSNRGATMEVAGGAALLVEPEDTAELAAAIATALTDEPARARLREAGLRRAAEFSWERAAHETADIYRSLIGGRV